MGWFAHLFLAVPLLLLAKVEADSGEWSQSKASKFVDQEVELLPLSIDMNVGRSSPGITITDPSDEQEWMACDDYSHIHFEASHEMSSAYQHIEVFSGNEHDDACLYMDGWLHTCASYRPHYHEVLVHYAARYIDEVKRVVFLGGGDSMVLHEVLKYPSLELVVGLELDPEVTRSSFINFGSQPHFDDPRVQWYYGDAAKSMSVLPRDYYGSFDLVLLDIQTDVASNLRVSDELNLMEVAMLLMKPGGIIVKNEDEGYVPGSSRSDFTRYSLDLAYHDVPMYCLQVLVLGSNSIDFLTATPKDHGVETLYLEGIDTFESQFDSWYNFGNEGSNKPSFCGKQDQPKANDTQAYSTPTTNLGVLMILEAENTTVTIDTAETLQAMIIKVLNDTDLREAGSVSSPVSDGTPVQVSAVVHVGEQGYIASRCFPLIHYCAFDIQLFGDSITKLDLLQEHLLNAVQSAHSSSYRFVTDGIGSGKNCQDLKQVGPPSIQDVCCEKDIDTQDIRPGTRIRKKKTAAQFESPNKATLHSYDNRRALSQWQSQMTVGAQALVTFEIPLPLDTSSISTLLSEAVNIVSDERPASQQVVSDESGDGLAIVASWSDGSLVATFDGSSRVDFNLFTTSRDLDTHDAIFYVEQENEWEVTVFQGIPRGIGSLVNFNENVEDIPRPIWA